MAIRKLDYGRYELDTRTGGRGNKRVRRLFPRKSDAVAFERYMLGKIERKEWDNRPQRDRRPLSEILDRWWLYHGQSLKNGEIGTYNAKKTADLCREKGWLKPGNDGKSSRMERLPGVGLKRVYVMNSDVIG
ncbi:hypothetical protein ACE3YX_000426 [Salmonella enterica]